MSTQINLETVSAYVQRHSCARYPSQSLTASRPINAQIDLYNDGDGPTFMHLTTGNRLVSMHFPSGWLC